MIKYVLLSFIVLISSVLSVQAALFDNTYFGNHFQVRGTDLQLGAAPFRQDRSIVPEVDSTYELGTSSRQWLTIFTDNASSTNTTTSRLAVSLLASGECVQTAAGGYLTTTGAACGAGGGSEYLTHTFNINGTTMTASNSMTLVNFPDINATNATTAILVANTSASTSALTFGTASGSSIAITNGTSTRLAVQSLTSGNCVQAAAGGYLVTAADPCGSGGGSQYTTYAWTLSGSTLTATTASTIVDAGGEFLFTNATGTIGVFNTSASSTSLFFGTATGSILRVTTATSSLLDVATRLRVATTTPTNVFTVASTTGAALFTINGSNINGNLLTVASSTGTALFQVATSGQLTIGIYGGRTHLNATGSNPVVNNCGTSPSIVGNDTAGIITAGSGAITNCNLVFNQPYVSSPACVVSEETVALALQVTASSTGIQIIAGSSFESDVFSYICLGVSE